MQTRQEASKQKNSNCIFLQRTTSNDPVGFNYVCRLDDWFDSNKKKPMIAKWKNRKIPKWLNDFEYAFEKKSFIFRKKNAKKNCKIQNGIIFDSIWNCFTNTQKRKWFAYIFVLHSENSWLAEQKLASLRNLSEYFLKDFFHFYSFFYKIKPN